MSYQEQASRTEAPITDITEDTLVGCARLIHASLGLQSEAGELADQLKRHIFYGQELDDVNLIEEIGDLLWYVALICNVLNVPLEAVMDRNIKKLQDRYPEKFTQENAVNRDLEKERETLEDVSGIISWEEKTT